MLHVTPRALRYCGSLGICAAIVACALYVTKSTAQSTSNASPIYGVTIPPGYRDWKMIAMDQPLIAALHWNRVPSEDNNKVLAGPFPGAESFLVGSAVNVQFMVKDSKKYAATGGWGFADFKDGKPGDEALHQTCWPCHQPARDRDFVFTHYAPMP